MAPGNILTVRSRALEDGTEFPPAFLNPDSVSIFLTKTAHPFCTWQLKPAVARQVRRRA